MPTRGPAPTGTVPSGMPHMQFRYKRKPVAVFVLPAMLPGAYDGTGVICDDGAVFASYPWGDGNREWIEGSPIPGTVRDMNVRSLNLTHLLPGAHGAGAMVLSRRARTAQRVRPVRGVSYPTMNPKPRPKRKPARKPARKRSR